MGITGEQGDLPEEAQEQVKDPAPTPPPSSVPPVAGTSSGEPQAGEPDQPGNDPDHPNVGDPDADQKKEGE